MSPSRPSSPGLALLQLAAAAAAVTWLWVCWCAFPGEIWNDVRLAPTFALARGLPVYPTATSGIINTWAYGPLPVALLWPATWADSAAHAALVAGAINLFLVTGAIAAVCAFWPAPAGSTLSPLDRLLAAALAVSVWTRLGFQDLQADNFAIAAGLLGNLVLMRAKTGTARWLAAACAVAALACKQTSIGVPAAQFIWLWLTSGRREALLHLGRGLVVGLALLAWMLAVFGREGIWYTLLYLPAKYPWAADLGARLRAQVWPLSVHLGVPAVVLLGFRRAVWRRDSVLLLPSLAWICALPPGFAALLKMGGSLNSLQSFLLWVPAAAVALLGFARSQRFAGRLIAGAALLVIALVGLRFTPGPGTPWRPLLERYRQADQLTRTFPGECWFPWDPVITLYSEGRYYHDEDGLLVRFVCQQPIPQFLVRAHLPSRMHVIAVRRGDVGWGIARSLMPADAQRTEIGYWTLYSWPLPAH